MVFDIPNNNNGGALNDTFNNLPKGPFVSLRDPKFNPADGTVIGNKGQHFQAPDTKITKFEFIMGTEGYRGTITMADTFSQGFYKGTSVLFEWIVSIMNVKPAGDAHFQLSFGWRGAGSDPVNNFAGDQRWGITYNITITNINYHLEENGVTAVLSYMATGYDVKYKRAIMDSNSNSKDWFTGQAVKKTPLDIIRAMIKLWNKPLQGTTPGQTINPTPKIEEEPILLPVGKNSGSGIPSAAELLDDQNEITPLDVYNAQGKSFGEAIDDLLTNNVSPKDTGKYKDIIQSSVYKWWTQQIAGKLYMVIFSITNGDSQIKRTYNYRGGANSDVISLTYKDSAPTMMYVQGFFNRTDGPPPVQAWSLDPKGDTMSIIPNVIDSKQMDDIQKLWGNLTGRNPDDVKKRTDQTWPSISDKTIVNIAESSWQDTSAAGRALMNQMVSFAMNQNLPTIDMTIMGDPDYILGTEYLIPRIQATNSFTEDVKNVNNAAIASKSQYVFLGNSLRLNVTTASGIKDNMLSGKYMILNYSHEINMGQYITRIHAMKIPSVPLTQSVTKDDKSGEAPQPVA